MLFSTDFVRKCIIFKFYNRAISFGIGSFSGISVPIVESISITHNNEIISRIGFSSACIGRILWWNTGPVSRILWLFSATTTWSSCRSRRNFSLIERFKCYTIQRDNHNGRLRYFTVLRSSAWLDFLLRKSETLNVRKSCVHHTGFCFRLANIIFTRTTQSLVVQRFYGVPSISNPCVISCPRIEPIAP